jgi:Putative transmembrane protein (PGPGW)
VVTLVVGAALLVLPGPGIAVVLLGLAILATEFTWAKRSMHQVKRQSSKVTRSVIRSRDSIAAKRGQKNDE